MNGEAIIDVIDWKLIGSCNLRCLHCYGPPKTQPALPIKDLLKLIDTFAMLGTRWVVLTGGEPLIIPQIEVVLQRLHYHGIKIALSTNTTFFRKHQQAIERYVSSLNIPIDGSSPMIHALSRRDEQSYFTFFDILDYYKAHPERKPELLRVGTVYSKANKKDFLTMAKVLEPYEDIIDTWKIYEIIQYETQPNLREPLLPDQGSFDKDMQNLLDNTSLAPKIHVAPANSRNKAYFMVNPKGQVIVPTDFNGITIEVPVGDLLRNPTHDVIARWQEKIQTQHYNKNHSHYGKLKVIQYVKCPR